MNVGSYFGAYVIIYVRVIKSPQNLIMWYTDMFFGGCSAENNLLKQVFGLMHVGAAFLILICFNKLYMCISWTIKCLILISEF